ncbi:MAG TPA: hypothetical protein VE093_36995 [Polyangiaceae bacterium]|nr:hypothetical protein [Polyangiaceae bacterium]
MRHVEWSLAAEATWKKLSMGDATLVAKAAVRFAETGQGDLEVISRDAKPTVRLRAGRFVLTALCKPYDGAVDHRRRMQWESVECR